MDLYNKQIKSEPIPPRGGNSPIAVIDIGSTSVRMVIAQVDESGKTRILESLSQAISLGRDTFTMGSIGKPSIEECVYALKSFKNVLEEYHLTDPGRIRALATSAVREASNREAFLNRVYVATGIDVEAIDETEVNRYIYLGVHPQMKSLKAFSRGKVVIVEVGGGSTQLLVLEDGRVSYSNAYRFGAFRIHEMLEHSRAPDARQREIMESQIQGMIDQMLGRVDIEGPLHLIILGGDARFIASQLDPGWDRISLLKVSTSMLKRLTLEILEKSADDLVREYHQPYPDAESMGPALFTYFMLTKTLHINQLYVSPNTLRDGVLFEMSSQDLWTEEFKEQIINTAIEMGKKYHFDQAHAEAAALICQKIFKAMQREHKLGSHYALLLTVAALLHEVGLFISNTSHHKHSMYIIQNSELFGLDSKDINLVAIIARYHRRALPGLNHEEYAGLDHEKRIVVSKLAAFLRVADAMVRKHGLRLGNVNVLLEEGQLVITTDTTEDLTLEQVAMQEKSLLFEQVYGIRVVIRRSSRLEGK